MFIAINNGNTWNKPNISNKVNARNWLSTTCLRFVCCIVQSSFIQKATCILVILQSICYVPYDTCTVYTTCTFNGAFAVRHCYLMSLLRITTWPTWSLQLSEINNIMYAVKTPYAMHITGNLLMVFWFCDVFLVWLHANWQIKWDMTQMTAMCSWQTYKCNRLWQHNVWPQSNKRQYICTTRSATGNYCFFVVECLHTGVTANLAWHLTLLHRQG